MDVEFEIKGFDQHHCVAVWKNLVIFVRRGESNPQNAQLALVHSRKIITDYEQGFGLIVWILPSALPPSKESREVTRRIVVGLRRSLRCGCVVIEGSSVKTSLMRTIVRGIVMLIRPDAKTGAVFSHIEDGARFVAPNLSEVLEETPSPKALECGLKAVLQDYESRLETPKQSTA